MSRSINNRDTNWKREWEEEVTLTPDEQREADSRCREEEALNAQIMMDLELMEEEEEWAEHQRQLREAERVVEDQMLFHDEYDEDYDYPLS